MKLNKHIQEALDNVNKYAPLINEQINLMRRSGIFEDEETSKAVIIPSVAKIGKTQREYKLEKCKIVCKGLELQKGDTVSRETKYQIAKDLGLVVGKFDNFKSGVSKPYQKITKMLSELGYTKKGATKYN